MRFALAVLVITLFALPLMARTMDSARMDDESATLVAASAADLMRAVSDDLAAIAAMQGDVTGDDLALASELNAISVGSR